MDNEYYLAWWNVENLFDLENSPDRHDWMQKIVAKELAGWNENRLGIKIKQLASVINSMNNDKGPDLLGLCEVESKIVLEKLVEKLNVPNRDYAIAHADASDKRGIDVAFIYDKNQISVELGPGGNENIFSHIIQKRSATRDILQVNFITRSNNNFIVVGNHWPSRSAGELESEAYRMIAGETLAYFMQRIHEIRGEIPIFVMGDFNDEPFNRSLTQYALSVNSIKKVSSKRAKNPYLYNLMWSIMNGKQGTYSFNGMWLMLDQILVNRAALDPGDIYCLPEDIEIFSRPGLVRRNAIIRHGRPATKSSYNPEGYSDHLPVTLKIRERI